MVFRILVPETSSSWFYKISKEYGKVTWFRVIHITRLIIKFNHLLSRFASCFHDTSTFFRIILDILIIKSFQ